MNNSLFDQLQWSSVSTDSWQISDHCSCDVLRLDKIHPLVSGNKWFKLKNYVALANQNKLSTLISFGGAYSNHLLALAYSARDSKLASVGIVRGEPGLHSSPTLDQARSLGMEIEFISREQYRNKDEAGFVSHLHARWKNAMIIPDGGYGAIGAAGAAEIAELLEFSGYSHIVCAVGTGTMMAGLMNASTQNQIVTGISVMKGNHALADQVRRLLKYPAMEPSILHEFHFGGYARYNAELIAFMNELYRQSGIPTDIVYTGKLFFAARALIQQNAIPHNSKVLLIHSGGLQGNRSLDKSLLLFNDEAGQ